MILNPLRHINPIGFVLLLLAGCGWVKPVMIDRLDSVRTDHVGPGSYEVLLVYGSKRMSTSVTIQVGKTTRLMANLLTGKCETEIVGEGKQNTATHLSGASCPSTPSVLYADKVYSTVLIGTQCWLGENLDVGTMVRENQTNNNIVEKYCHNHNPANCATFGGLYQWGEAMQYATTRGAHGICPPGWHIPTLAEFKTLRSHGGQENAGNDLKREDQGSADLGAAGTNASGFSALLGGFRYQDGEYRGLGYDAGFRTSENSTTSMWLDSSDR